MTAGNFSSMAPLHQTVLLYVMYLHHLFSIVLSQPAGLTGFFMPT